MKIHVCVKGAELVEGALYEESLNVYLDSGVEKVDGVGGQRAVGGVDTDVEGELVQEGS